MGRRSLEEEFRSSQTNKILSEAGRDAAEVIANGVSKVAKEIDKGINSFFSGQKNTSGASQPAGNTQPRQNTAQTPPVGQQTARQPADSSAYRQSAQAGQGSYQTAQNKTNTAPGQQSVQQNNKQPSQRDNQPPQPQSELKLIRKKSSLKFYVTGGIALAYAFWAPMYEPVHFIIFAAVVVLSFVILSLILPGKKQWVRVVQEPEPKREPEKKEEYKVSTGDPEVDKLITDGMKSLEELRAANDAIPDESMSESIDRMEKAAKSIFEYIAEHPEKVSQIRKFMNYYLPTTLKLLKSYQRLSSQSVKGETVSSAMFNIAGMMHTVAGAFEKQLDSLFTHEAMDISADITVFETMLKQEGFVEESGKK